MIRIQKHGNDFIRKQVENKLQNSIAEASNIFQYRHEREYASKIIAESAYSFVNDEKYLFSNEDLSREISEQISDILFQMKSQEGESSLEKIENYISSLLQDIAEDRAREESEGEPDPSDVEKILEELKEMSEVNMTRSEGSSIQEADEESVFQKSLDEAIRLMTAKSNKKERRRAYNTQMSQMHQMNKTQALFGQKMLMYRAAKKRLKIKTRLRKKNAIYVSMDNSGSMWDVKDKARDFISRLVASGDDIMYACWNYRLNGSFKKITGTFSFRPDGEDSLYYCAMQSISEVEEGSVLAVVTDGTTYLYEGESKILFEQAEKKNVHLMIISFGSKENYQMPRDKKERLIAY